MIGLCVALLGCAPVAPEPAPPVHSDGRVLMGTVFELQILAVNDAQALVQVVFDETARLEALVSHYDPDSEVSRLAGGAGGGPRDVDPALAGLLRRSLELGVLTEGAFDITLGPALGAWREAGPAGIDAVGLAELRARTGQDKLVVRPDGGVELQARGMALDLGAIAKGWALDHAVERLRAVPVESALLSFGQSSVWALGAPPMAPGWNLALRSPDGGVQGIVTLRDQALSFSSSLPAREPGAPGLQPGRAPLVDPRTLQPVERRATAVVVGRDATLADALTTALLVLEPASGRALVESLSGVEALMVEEDGAAWHSEGWQAATHYRPTAR